MPFRLDPATSRTNLLTQWLGPPVKCCLCIKEWLELGLWLRLGSPSGLWFGLGLCQHPNA